VNGIIYPADVIPDLFGMIDGIPQKNEHGIAIALSNHTAVTGTSSCHARGLDSDARPRRDSNSAAC
jgi:hypothetical protein